MKIKKILFVDNPKIQNKWWHRLHQVVITICLIVLFLFGTLLIVFSSTHEAGNASWIERQYTSYSFEDSYYSDPSSIENCYFHALLDTPSITCGDYHDSENFLKDYTTARGTYETFEAGNEEYGFTYDSVMNSLINDGRFDDMKVKYTNNILWFRLAVYFCALITILIISHLLLESVIYRVIIYIIYGNK